MDIPIGFGQVNFKFSGNGLPHGAQISFGIANTTDLSAAEVAQNALDAWQDCLVMGYLSVQVAVTGCLVKLGPNDIGPAAEVSASLAGSSGSEPLPPNVAALVTKNTAQGGHSGKGRFFIPGLPEGSTPGGGQIEVSPLGNLQTSMNTFLAGLAGGEIPMYLLHSVRNEARPVLSVESLQVQKVMATQRRRLRG